MSRKSGLATAQLEKVNGYAPEKVAFRHRLLQVNGFAPEKFRDLGDFVHFIVHFWTNGYQKEAILPSQATDCSPGKLNGYAPEYVNCPQNIDRAMLRTGRMDSLVYVPLPDKECRRQMIAYHLADRPMDADIDYNVLAELSKGMNASDIETMVNVVAMNAARSRSIISQQMLEEQARSQRRSVILGKEKDGNEFAKMISMQPTRDRQAIGFTAYKS